MAVTAKQLKLIKDLRLEIVKRDAYIDALKGYVEEQRELIGDYRVQIEEYGVALDQAVKAAAYQPRRSRSYGANFWPRLAIHSGAPVDTDWRGNKE